MSKQIIVVLPGGYGNATMTEFADLRSDQRVLVLDQPMKDLNNGFLELLRKVHLSAKVNRIIDLPLKGLWGTWGSTLRDIAWEEDQAYIVVFIPLLCPIMPSYLKRIRKRYNVKYALVLLDGWDTDRSDMSKYYEEHVGFDYILTFDPGDAIKYHFEFSGFFYSIVADKQPRPIEKDLYLVALPKGRLSLFHELYCQMSEHGVTSLYRLVNVPEMEREHNGEISYSEPIAYSQILEELKTCNCILEVLVEGQTGVTNRYYEAVCYNKKLLTNNKDVVNLPFYNPNYIHVMEKIEDIDWNWVKERVPVDYHYDGRFSPTHLIDRIIELDEKREGRSSEEE